MTQLALRLSPQDLQDFSESEQRILNLMLDGRSHSAEEIRMVAGKNGKPASEGLRRLRALREKGYIIRRVFTVGRNFSYRMEVE